MTTRRQALQKLATGALFPAAVLGISVGEASAKGEGGKDGTVEVRTERDHDRYRAFGGRVAICLLVCSRVVFVMDEVACICGYCVLVHSVYRTYDLLYLMYDGVKKRKWCKPVASTSNGMYKVSLSRRRSDSQVVLCGPRFWPVALPTRTLTLPCTRAAEAGQQAVDLGKGSATQGFRCELASIDARFCRF